MKRKPIKIDWDDLEEAFSSRRAESSSTLDAITGHVILDGEGEHDDLLDDDPTVAAATAAPVREDRTRLPVRPPDMAMRIEWLQGFLEQNSDVPAEVAGELTEAMDDSNAAQVIFAILNRNPEVRDAWYVYRSDRLHELIDAWLKENGVQPTDPPPLS